jgi:hypothetical protein
MELCLLLPARSSPLPFSYNCKEKSANLFFSLASSSSAINGMFPLESALLQRNRSAFLLAFNFVGIRIPWILPVVATLIGSAHAVTQLRSCGVRHARCTPFPLHEP